MKLNITASRLTTDYAETQKFYEGGYIFFSVQFFDNDELYGDYIVQFDRTKRAVYAFLHIGGDEADPAIEECMTAVVAHMWARGVWEV